MAKALDLMSARELQDAYDRSSAKRSKLNTEMIEAGRGYEKPSETRTKTDDLARRVNEEGERFDAITREMDRRKTYHGSLKPIQKTKWA
jgi:hypothetical protein